MNRLKNSGKTFITLKDYFELNDSLASAYLTIKRARHTPPPRTPRDWLARDPTPHPPHSDPRHVSFNAHPPTHSLAGQTPLSVLCAR